MPSIREAIEVDQGSVYLVLYSGEVPETMTAPLQYYRECEGVQCGPFDNLTLAAGHASTLDCVRPGTATFFRAYSTSGRVLAQMAIKDGDFEVKNRLPIP